VEYRPYVPALENAMIGVDDLHPYNMNDDDHDGAGYDDRHRLSGLGIIYLFHYGVVFGDVLGVGIMYRGEKNPLNGYP
jgi:hypothetical protein